MTSDFRPPTSDFPPRASRLGCGLVLFLLLLQFWSRYMPSPWAVFVADDWANWARASLYLSAGEAAFTGLQDPNRPLSTAAVEVLFRWFGNDARAWTGISVLGNAALLAAWLGVVWGLTRRKAVVLVAGTFFALVPTLTETFHWSTQVLNEVACALMFYSFSAWMWVDYVRHGKAWRLGLSSLGYLIGVFSYEAGLLLPAAYVVLLTWRSRPLMQGLKLVPFGLVFVAYGLWRVTDAFGMNQAWHYPAHMQAGLSGWGILWNIRELVHWWMGDHLAGSLLGGWQSFATLAPWVRRGLVLGNLLVVSGLGWLVWRTQTREANGDKGSVFSPAQVLAFGWVWTAAAMAIPVLSYTAPRLNVLPALGISLLVGWLLARFPVRLWGPWMAIPAVLALIANQGTSESFRQAGILHQRFFMHLQVAVNEWQTKELLLVETGSLRHRLTRGLLTPQTENAMTWADYHNALLPRGFVPRGMVQKLLHQRNPGIQTLLDVEHGARITGKTLIWHDRYDPASARQTAMDRVYRVDLGTLLWGDAWTRAPTGLSLPRE